MKKILSFLLVAVFLTLPIQNLAQPGSLTIARQTQTVRPAFVIHGGAGVIKRGSLSPEREKAYRAGLEQALLAGYKALQDGKSAMDAVEVAIRLLEDNPLFNAGKGAVFTNDGRNELDASVMDGKNLMAGAVAGLHRVKNPITLARAVMEKSPHVMMVGDGAEKFAAAQNIELVDEKYFFTQPRWDDLQRILEREKKKAEMPDSRFQIPDSKEPDANPHSALRVPHSEKYGTVGAVALDKSGNLAAGTSTGGMTNKRYGRVGDVPVIGAGTYANNNTCAVSATGWGEYFIRVGVARDISALMEYKNLPVQQAADTVLQKVKTLGGDGGVIVLDKTGNVAISFNSEGMYRAYIDQNGRAVVEIYKNETSEKLIK